MTLLAPQIAALKALRTTEVVGSVVAMRGLSVLVDDLPLPVGTMVRFQSVSQGNTQAHRAGAQPSPLPSPSGRGGAAESPRGEIVGFDGPHSVVMLFNSSVGIAPGTHVVGEQSAQTVSVGRSLMGRVIDGLGRPIDGKGRLTDLAPRPLNPPPTAAMSRRRIREPLPTGVRALDTMLTVGKGQRVGIFSGPGVGKSTLLAMVARNTTADVNVIGLIGERGREVRQFIEDALGPTGLARSAIIVATGDESPLLRVRAALVASAVAEHFRNEGADVMLLVDSLTRFAHAQRQIGLTIGEQPATKGYTPSVFAMLPMLVERAGAIDGGGSITGFYNILVEGDDLTEPISDATRGILDGHISLARRLATRGHYPAIDLLESISRVADDVCDQHHIAARRRILKLLAAYAQAEELINIGAYARGSNRDCDIAIAMKQAIDSFLTQGVNDRAEYPRSCKALLGLAAEADRLATLPPNAASAGPGAGPGTGAKGTAIAQSR